MVFFLFKPFEEGEVQKSSFQDDLKAGQIVGSDDI